MTTQHNLGQASTFARQLDSGVGAAQVPDVVSLLDDDNEEDQATLKSQRYASREPERAEKVRSQSVDKSPRKRRVVEAPRTLVEHAERKGYSSVSDLVSPAWCEYALNYNILGLSHLPLAERPLTIHTSTGAQIIRDITIAIQRDKVMDEGKVSSSTDELDDVERWELGIQERLEAIKARRRETRQRQYSSSPEKGVGLERNYRKLDALKRSLTANRTAAGLSAPASSASAESSGRAIVRARTPPSSAPSGAFRAPTHTGASLAESVINPAYVPGRAGNKTSKQVERNLRSIKASRIRHNNMTMGKRQHKILEREIHPIEVHVRTKTREDAWALRLLRLITGLRSLIDGGKVRELPVFGLIHGRLVLGVIDEISRVDMAQLSVSSSAVEPPASDATTSAKRWASQEEWKRQSKQKTSAPAKKKQSGKSSSAQPTLAAFGIGKLTENTGKEGTGELLLPPSQIVKGSGSENFSVKRENPDARWGFVISDTKTRYSPTLPAASSQRSARLQCMVYKRLLDGLLAPFVPEATASGEVSEASRPTHALTLDSLATALDPQTLFAALDLDTQARLSPAFAQDAAPLCDGYGVHLLRLMPVSKRAPSEVQDTSEADTAEQGEEAGRQASRYSAKLLGRRFFQRTNSFGNAEASLVGQSPAPIDLTLDDVMEQAAVEQQNTTELSCTLADVGHVLVATLRELLRVAAEGAGLDGAQPGLGAMHKELQLHYVSQVKGSMGRFNKRPDRASGRSTAKPAKHARGTHSQGSPRKSSQTQLPFASQKSPAVSEIDDTEDEEAQLQRALKLSMQDQTPIAEAEERDEEGMILSQNVPLPPASQQQAKEKSPRPSQLDQIGASTALPSELVVDLTQSSPPSTPQQSQRTEASVPASPLAPKGKVIGIVRFTHLAQDLDAHLRSVLRMWTGARPLRGVARDNVWRCDGCEFKDGCEWRSNMARLDQERFRARKKREEHRRAAVLRLAKRGQAQTEKIAQMERHDDEEALMWDAMDEIEVGESQGRKAGNKAALPIVLEVSSDEEVLQVSDNSRSAVAQPPHAKANKIVVLQEEELWSQLDGIDQVDLGDADW